MAALSLTMFSISSLYRGWVARRAATSPLPYHPLPLHRRVGAALLDFLPATVLFMVDFTAGGSLMSGQEPLRDFSFLFLTWNLPRILAATVFRRSLGQMLLGGGIRSRHDGRTVNAARAGFRSALAVLDYVPGVALVNVLMAFSRRDRRTAYDLAAGTVLVDVERPQPADWESQVQGSGFHH